MHGHGKLYYEIGVLAYEGGFKEDCFHGRGVLWNYEAMIMKKDFDWRNLGKVGDYWKVY